MFAGVRLQLSGSTVPRANTTLIIIVKGEELLSMGHTPKTLPAFSSGCPLIQGGTGLDTWGGHMRAKAQPGLRVPSLTGPGVTLGMLPARIKARGSPRQAAGALSSRRPDQSFRFHRCPFLMRSFGRGARHGACPPEWRGGRAGAKKGNEFVEAGGDWIDPQCRAGKQRSPKPPCHAFRTKLK